MTRLQFKCNTKAAYMLLFIIILSALWLSNCTPVTDSRVLLKEDLSPPVFLALDVNDSHTVSLQFNEDIEYCPNSYSCSPGLSLSMAHTHKQNLTINLKDEMEPGTEYKLECTVEDATHNTHTVLACFYGFNPDIPSICLNEITTQGSSTHPDKVELLVQDDGNTAGLCLFDGTRDFCRQSKILPPINVKSGDYIVVHFKPVGTDDEIDETDSQHQCRADDSVMGAWDLWVKDGKGLSGNNGVVTVYSHSNGDLLDGFLYSNRTSESDEDYRGFGSDDTMNRADQLWLQDGWKAAGRLIVPEDAVNPDDSTATRSMCRSPGAEDTDTSADWYIVDTSESSFGAENSTVLYGP